MSHVWGKWLKDDSGDSFLRGVFAGFDSIKALLIKVNKPSVDGGERGLNRISHLSQTQLVSD